MPKKKPLTLPNPINWTPPSRATVTDAELLFEQCGTIEPPNPFDFVTRTIPRAGGEICLDIEGLVITVVGHEDDFSSGFRKREKKELYWQSGPGSDIWAVDPLVGSDPVMHTTPSRYVIRHPQLKRDALPVLNKYAFDRQLRTRNQWPVAMTRYEKVPGKTARYKLIEWPYQPVDEVRVEFIDDEWMIRWQSFLRAFDYFTRSTAAQSPTAKNCEVCLEAMTAAVRGEFEVGGVGAVGSTVPPLAGPNLGLNPMMTDPNGVTVTFNGQTFPAKSFDVKLVDDIMRPEGQNIEIDLNFTLFGEDAGEREVSIHNAIVRMLEAFRAEEITVNSRRIEREELPGFAEFTDFGPGTVINYDKNSFVVQEIQASSLGMNQEHILLTMYRVGAPNGPPLNLLPLMPTEWRFIGKSGKAKVYKLQGMTETTRMGGPQTWHVELRLDVAATVM